MTRHNGMAVLFDLDGTLVDTLPDIHDALVQVLAAEGRPSIPMARTRTLVGRGARMLVSDAFADHGQTPADDDLDRLIAHYVALQQERPGARARPFPGTLKALEALAAEGIPMGVCTNKPHDLSIAVLEALGLLDLFAAVVGADATPHRKPDGRHITDTLTRMEANGLPAVLIGDSESDVAAARDAGIPVIVMSHGYSRVPAADLGADLVIDHFDRLRPALDRLHP